MNPTYMLAELPDLLASMQAEIDRLTTRVDALENEIFPERRLEAAPALISLAEAARLAGRHRNTVQLWVQNGRLEIVERTGREALVRRDDVLRIIQEREP